MSKASLDENVHKWTRDDVCNFIKTIPGCDNDSSLMDLFSNQDIDGEALLLMKEHDLVKLMNIKLGKAIKIFNCILKIRNKLK